MRLLGRLIHVGGQENMKEITLLIFSLLAGGTGYLIVTFWMNPILRYLTIRHEVTSDLLFYWNVMHERNWESEIIKKRAEERRISNRKHASEIAACWYRLPTWYKTIFLKRNKEDPLAASIHLIGLSNSSNDTYEKHAFALQKALNIDVISW